MVYKYENPLDLFNALAAGEVREGFRINHNQFTAGGE